jgi:adenine-specific DNA-methyltransferase
LNNSSTVKSKRVIRVPGSCVVQTPVLLAEAMVKSLGKHYSDTWLEPCVGNGALLSALSKFGIKKNKIFGLDVDPISQPNDRLAKISRGTEFLRWSRSTKLRFSKIVANPPYVAIERLHPSIRKAATEASLSDQIRITENGNAWYAFLCAAIRLLKSNGSLCFLLPAAWDFANYAAPLRNSINKYFVDVKVYRTAKPIFRAEKVQEGTIILLAKGRRDLTCQPSSNISPPINRREVKSIDELILALTSNKKINNSWKDQNNTITAPAIRKYNDRQLLRDILNIRLGIVSGDSSYFLLNENRRRELRLPLTSVVPVLSRARHLASARITDACWNKLLEIDERVWLFNPSSLVVNNRFVQSYLRFGRNGGCDRQNHKIAIRNPWFQFQNLTENDGFMSGMSTTMPWLCFRSMPKLAATNTLYVVNFTNPQFSQQQRIGIALSLLTSDVREQLRERGRIYAAGLLKFEPSDLLSLQVPKAGDVIAGWKIYQRALRALRDGDEMISRMIADSYFLK